LLRNPVLRNAKVFKNLALRIGVFLHSPHHTIQKRLYLDHQEKYSALAAKYLAGQVSPAEEQDLLAWTDANPDHQKLFEEWTQTWALTEGAAASPFETDLGAAWAKVEPKSAHPPKSSVCPKRCAGGAWLPQFCSQW
jgi:ferric-dicitrate binding protein FerR (iron transport regulator)